jgi:flavin-dependent dehydrogenase
MESTGHEMGPRGEAMIFRYDLCVLGGGLAGSAFAILMVRRGARVVLVEKTGFEVLRAGEHLPPEARGALRALDCEADLLRGAVIESPGILSRWVSRAALFKPYIGHVAGLGLNLTRRHFDAALFHQARRAGVTTHQGASLESAVRANGAWEIAVRVGGERIYFRAQRVVDASGSTSAFARRQGAQWQSHGDMIAAVGRLRPAYDGPADNLCLQVDACPHGWWSVTPTRRDVIATFYASAATKRGMRFDARRWWHWGLQAAPGVRERLRRTTVGLEEVRIVPAFPRLLRTMYGTEWFAIGDAAATHDPLSGHGIQYVFESAFRAAEMASVDVSLERLGPMYQEAITARFARHIDNRARAYAEAAPMFAGAPFWREMTAIAA